jgi:hypothetical protein
MTTRSYGRTYPRLYPWRAFAVALLLYLLLSVREMSAWTRPVWMILAFGAVPGISAFVLGRGGTTRDVVRASFGSVGTAMALYTAFHLIRLHRGIGSTGDAGTAVNVFFAGLAAAIVYGLLAGAVCAGVAQLRARLGSKGTER